LKKILYIEDDPVSQAVIGKLVERMGHQMIGAVTSEEGLEKAYSEKPDLIMMDIHLPGLDGYEATIKLKNSESLRDIPIIAITANNHPTDRQSAFVSGCNGFLTKPVEYDQFASYLTDFLERRRVDDIRLEMTDEKAELRKFTGRLVQRLTDKIQELQESNRRFVQTNQKLDKSIAQIKSAHGDLMEFNHISHQLLGYSRRETLYRNLPGMLCEQLRFQSAGIFVVNEHDLTLDLFSHAQVTLTPECEKIAFVKPPFFDLVYYQEPCMIDYNWLVAAERADKALVERTTPLLRGFHSHSVYFLPITGRPKAENDFACENQDCHAFLNRDGKWWNKKIYKLDPAGLAFESELKEVSQYYFNCCQYGLRGVLALGIEESRWNDSFRQMIQAFVRTVGLTIENIQLVEDTQEAYLIAEKQAITDGLTELYNYRYFHHQLEREIKRAKRHWYKTSLIMMDIDYFKRYNDTHGHPAGDVVLKRVSDLIKETTRTSDILARYGGEEFVLVLPETPKNAALKLAEKIRQLIENEKFPNAETQPNGRVTISLGVATFPDDAQDIEALVQKADEQLYRAKSEGRNRVVSIE
jgi:diguanylate cyclase (GGDEF)-like protein